MSEESGRAGENSSGSPSKELHETGLYHDVKPTQWPIIYSEEYNISFCGLEKLHPFDAGKWGKVFAFLKGLQSFHIPVFTISDIVYKIEKLTMCKT
jgi:hypothetical protein